MYRDNADMKNEQRRKKFSDQIRQAIDECGITRYRIAQDTELSESALSRFMSGYRGLSMTALDELAAYLDLEVTMKARNVPEPTEDT